LGVEPNNGGGDTNNHHRPAENLQLLFHRCFLENRPEVLRVSSYPYQPDVPLLLAELVRVTLMNVAERLYDGSTAGREFPESPVMRQRGGSRSACSKLPDG